MERDTFCQSVVCPSLSDDSLASVAPSAQQLIVAELSAHFQANGSANPWAELVASWNAFSEARDAAFSKLAADLRDAGDEEETKEKVEEKAEERQEA
jgi:hypothetical protein